MSQEFRFWHRTSPEAAHEVKARSSAFIWRTNQGWRISFQDAHLSGSWQETSFFQWTCPQALCVSLQGEREGEESVNTSYGLISEVTQCLFYHTLCNSSKLLGLATLKKRRINLHFLMGGVSNSLWRCFKNFTGRTCSQMMQVLILGPDFEQKVLKDHQWDFSLVMPYFWYHIHFPNRSSQITI